MQLQAEEIGNAGPDGGVRRHRGLRLAWLGAWLGATALLLWIWRPSGLGEIRARLGAAEPRWILVALASNLAVLAFWTRQWMWLVPPGFRTSRGRIAEVIALTAAAMNTLPFPGGHSLGVGLLVRRGGLSWNAAVSVMALDQLCEGVAKVGLFLFAAGVAPLPDWLHRAALAVSAGVLVLLAALVGLSLIVKAGPDTANALLRWVQHLAALRNPRALGGGLAMGFAMKLAQAGGILAAQRSLGIHLPAADLALVLAAVSVASMITVSPGNLTVYEAAAVLAYRYLGVAPGPALAAAVLQHACLLVAMIVPGYAVIAWHALSGGGPSRKSPRGPRSPQTR
ncbi:MAG TPA: lysylphosphatidylglycerol synthase transmembrane domain-containing protein [Opitutaceae bacterium]|nr:lysylphosphatidylglycerol synthase transmembrane domain-containing protein [Opitutaceae bacterium]